MGGTRLTKFMESVQAVAREAPTDGLVAPAERTSVVAQA